MRLKVTLRRPAGEVDLSITADATASVADVAAHLAAADPAGGAPSVLPQLTLRASDGTGPVSSARLLDGDIGILDSGIRSGSRIELVEAYPGSELDREQAAAILRVLAGPDAGKEFRLVSGANVVGRDRTVDVRLSDPLVSKRHARISVAEQVEITDLNSANGVLLSGDPVTRVSLTPSDVVTLGDTSLCVVRLQGAVGARGAQIEHVRSPRVVPRYPGRKIPTPKPPALPQPMRFPMVAMAAPLLMGAVMYAITPQISAIVMMAMSPLMMIGAWVDQSMTSRRVFRTQKKQFDQGMIATLAELERERGEEQRVRSREAPSLSELEAEISRLGPLLWTTRPEHIGFMQVRLGSGRATSRNVVVVPENNETLPEYWEQLVALRAQFSNIEDVPIVIDLKRDGALGIAGPREEGTDVARGLVLQLLALHSPAEMVVAALVSPASRPDWEWLKWVPHTSSAHSPLAGEHLADGPTAASALVAQVEGLIDQRVAAKVPSRRGAIGLGPEKDDEVTPMPPTLVVLVEGDAPIDRGRITRMVERGPDAGVHVIWSAPTVGQLPAACRAFVSVDRTNAGGIAGMVRLGTQAHPVTLEPLLRHRAEELARQLAPVVDVGVPEADDSDLPRSVSYANLAGPEILDSVDFVVDRWRANNSLVARDESAPVRRRKEAHLRALVGHAGAAPLFLDLRRDGPHALVGGTTGAGKSEFLQSWVLGMAAANSPDRLTFLFVDYKGGAAFADCVKLPHTVGLVTDLSPHLVRRALTSLRAELRHREHVLQRKKAKDLLTLEKTGDPDCPPSLVIIVDEFAALVQEVPEFVDGVVDVAQRGRSLGLHLILATQRPAGVIKENLRANTNLRVALRMADTDDSTDILGDPMAAHFDPATPGRGAVKTGPGRIQTFQAGYAGGWTTNEPPKPRIEVVELGFGNGAVWEAPEVEEATTTEHGPTDIARIVGNVRAAAESVRIAPPRKPWLAELAPIYSFGLLPNPRTDEKLPLGVLDRPEAQSQPTVFYEPDRDGNLAVFGTGGSGKSTALRTIAVAAAATTRNGGPTHVYGLDFGSRGLQMLEDLPHVGAIVPGDDEERVIRTIRMLRDLVEERAVRYAALRAGSIGEYRKLASAPDEPRIILLVDGIGVFKEHYEFGPGNLSQWFTAFAQVAADGRSVGVHVVMTGDRPNSIPATVAATVQRRIVLRMANEDEYLNLGVPRDVLNASSPAGRGILDDHEVQIAILGDSGNVAVQARELQKLGESLARTPLERPAPVRRLPDQVKLADLPCGSPGRPVIGIDDLSLAPATFEATGALMLAGPPASGRTTAMGTIAAALGRTNPSIRQVLVSPRRSALAGRAWSELLTGSERIGARIPTLIEELERGSSHRYALFIESIAEFTGSDLEYDLDRLVKVAVREEHLVIGESETSTWSQAYTLAAPFKAGRRGLLLVPSDLDGDSLLGTPLGRIRRADFPAGRGFLVTGGRAAKLQVAQDLG